MRKASNSEAKRRWKINPAIAQTLAIANTTIWNVLKKKETTGLLTQMFSVYSKNKGIGLAVPVVV